LIPALPLPPPPTTNKRTAVTPAGTVHSQLPISLKVKTVSPPTVVVTGTHAAAFAGTGIETKRLVSRIAEITVAIFGRTELPFMRTKSRITFTSLFSIKRERPKRKSGVRSSEEKSTKWGDVHL
jgi:hypothetical protein